MPVNRPRTITGFLLTLKIARTCFCCVCLVSLTAISKHRFGGGASICINIYILLHIEIVYWDCSGLVCVCQFHDWVVHIQPLIIDSILCTFMDHLYGDIFEQREIGIYKNPNSHYHNCIHQLFKRLQDLDHHLKWVSSSPLELLLKIHTSKNSQQLAFSSPHTWMFQKDPQGGSCEGGSSTNEEPVEENRAVTAWVGSMGLGKMIF